MNNLILDLVATFCISWPFDLHCFLRAPTAAGGRQAAGRQLVDQPEPSSRFDSPEFHPLQPDSTGRLGVSRGLSEGVAGFLVP